jgi:hypothetical protein
MRELLEAIEEYKSGAGQRTFWLVDIHLKADGDYEAEDLYFSTQAVEANEQNYQPLLKSKPNCNFVLGSSSDVGGVKIDNTDLSFGQIIVPKDRYISGSPVKIWFGWKLNDGTIETDEVFNGNLLKANLVVADNAVNLNLVGDLYNPSFILGAFPLAQRCVAEFNVNGTRSIGDGLCDWQSNMGGNPLFCDKTKDGPDGAEAHWCQKMVAIPFFANVTIQIVNTPEESSGFQQVGRTKENPELEPYYPNIY